jgi:hypothetical protein
MSEVEQAKGKQPLGSQLASTVMVILVLHLLLAVIGLLTGSNSVGTPELVLLTVVWVVGLLWV